MTRSDYIISWSSPAGCGVPRLLLLSRNNVGDTYIHESINASRPTAQQAHSQGQAIWTGEKKHDFI
jgi:hypothetical protein